MVDDVGRGGAGARQVLPYEQLVVEIRRCEQAHSVGGRNRVGDDEVLHVSVHVQVRGTHHEVGLLGSRRGHGVVDDERGAVRRDVDTPPDYHHGGEIAPPEVVSPGPGLTVVGKHRPVRGRLGHLVPDVERVSHHDEPAIVCKVAPKPRCRHLFTQRVHHEEVVGLVVGCREAGPEEGSRVALAAGGCVVVADHQRVAVARDLPWRSDGPRTGQQQVSRLAVTRREGVPDEHAPAAGARHGQLVPIGPHPPRPLDVALGRFGV